MSAFDNTPLGGSGGYNPYNFFSTQYQMNLQQAMLQAQAQQMQYPVYVTTTVSNQSSLPITPKCASTEPGEFRWLRKRVAEILWHPKSRPVS